MGGAVTKSASFSAHTQANSTPSQRAERHCTCGSATQAYTRTAAAHRPTVSRGSPPKACDGAPGASSAAAPSASSVTREDKRTVRKANRSGGILPGRKRSARSTAGARARYEKRGQRTSRRRRVRSCFRSVLFLNLGRHQRCGLKVQLFSAQHHVRCILKVRARLRKRPPREWLSFLSRAPAPRTTRRCRR